MPWSAPAIRSAASGKAADSTWNEADDIKMTNDALAERYVGPLSPAQAASGIAAATQTARRLLIDAELLLENKRWERATALAILAIEEMGKVSILRSILLARNAEELKSEWRSYRSHAKKNVRWISLDLFLKGARKLEDYKAIFDSRSPHGRVLDALKQDCFYSDASENGKWSSPDQKISPQLAKNLFAVAKMEVQDGPSPMTSEAELELWVKHLLPVLKGPMPEMKKALAACYTEAEEKGVLRGNNTAAGMLSFLFGHSTPMEQ